jgi:DNA-binding NtrC family response regulator
MTPPRMPPPADADVKYLRYAVALLSALAAEGGARERAAARLGLPVRTLTRHLDQLGLRDLCASDGESAIWPRSGRQPPPEPQQG